MSFLAFFFSMCRLSLVASRPAEEAGSLHAHMQSTAEDSLAWSLNPLAQCRSTELPPFLSAQLDHGFTIKRSGSLDYYQQPGMYWIRYEMVQLNSQCFHGNVLAVSINQFLRWINMLLICYPVHMLLYQFRFNLD